MHTLDQLVARLTALPLVAIFFYERKDVYLDSLVRACVGTQCVPLLVNVHAADQTLLDKYMVTGVPVCVFVKNNSWSYIMQEVSERNVKGMIAWMEAQV